MQTLLDLFLTNTVYAQTTTPTITTTSTIVVFVGKVDRLLINPLIIFMFSAAFLYFIYGALEFFINSASAGEKGTGKQHMLWGVVGMFLMISVFGIMKLIESTFGLGSNVLIQ